MARRVILSVLGATGYVGNHLIARLEKSAPEIGIRAFGRNLTKLSRLEGRANIESIHSYAYGEGMGDRLAGSDACIDLTYSILGIPSEVMAGARNHARTLIRAAHAAGLKRVVITGTIGVYGEPVIRHPWETAPDAGALRPDTIYGRAKTAVEEVASREARRLGVSVAFIRAGHILGPGSNMAAGIAGKILTCMPTMLGAGPAVSNATTVDGLAETLVGLATADAGEPLIFANHVDMENVSYDEIVESMAHTIGIHAVTGAAATDGGRKGNRLVGLLRANKKKILLAQARVGRYDLGLSARIVSRLKHRIGGDEPGAPTGGQDGAALAPLYRSQAVPHTANICGPAIAASARADRLSSIDRWLRLTGYAGRTQAAP